jgi:ABC-type dipeptide/oligopeptide/nickel transport system ATPase component
MRVLGELRSSRELALILITHDTPLAILHTSTALVLAEGRLVEPADRPRSCDGAAPALHRIAPPATDYREPR